MNIVKKILGLDMIEDLTESPWWTDTIFQGLEQDLVDEQSIDGIVAAANDMRAELG